MTQIGMQVDKEIARRHFSRAARSYNAWSEPQKRMADRLMASLAAVERPESILDVGCGTGLLTERLEAAYPNSKITAIDIAEGMIEECRRKWGESERVAFAVADVESLDLDQQFDLIVSNSCFQWVSDLQRAMLRIAEHLQPSGRVIFSATTRGTLQELWSSYAIATSGNAAGHRLPDLEDYVRSVVRAGLAIESAREETTVLTYDKPEHVIRSLRGIGATRAAAGARAGLSRSQLKAVIETYRKHFSTEDGRVTCAYRAAYVKARR